MAVIECVCPPKADGSAKHPNGDTITLRERLDFRSALTARNTVILLKQEDEDASVADVLASLTEVYLLMGIKSWTLTDAKGKAIEPNRTTIRAFMDEHPDAAMAAGDEADGLYSEAVILPLVARASASSLPTPMPVSTSVTNGSSPVHPKPSRRSSITTIRTGDTGKTSASPAGVSN